MSRIWASQPQVPVGIDWSNPLTRGLVLANNPLGLDVRGINGSKISSWTTGSVEPSSPIMSSVLHGLGRCIYATHDYADLTGTSASVSDSSPITVLSLHKMTAYDSDRGIFTRGQDGAGSGWSVRLTSKSSGVIEAGVVLTSGGTAGFSATGTSNQTKKNVIAALT